MNTNMKKITFTALFAAILCVISPFTIPLGVIPISLATFGVYLSGAVLGFRRGCAAVLIYIALGAAGLPVFSGFSGGVAKICGVTGGYIIGYILCAAAIGLITERKSGFIFYPVSMIIGTVLCYTFGTAWFIYLTHTNLYAALFTCVIPFLIGDAIKIAAASIVAHRLRKHFTF